MFYEKKELQIIGLGTALLKIYLGPTNLVNCNSLTL